MLKLIIEKLEDVAEPLREHYVAAEGDLQGKYILDGEESEGYKVAPVASLMKALNTERDARKTLASQVEQFSDLDPKKAKEALARLASLDAEVDDKTKAKLDILRRQIEDETGSKISQLSEKHQDALDKAMGRSKTLESRLRSALITERATKALVEAGARAPKLLLPHIEKAVSMQIDENGNEIIAVRGDDNQPLMSRKPGSTANMSIEEFVTSLKDDDQFAVAFEGSKASGFTSGKTERSRGSDQQFQGTPQERLRQAREANKNK